MTTTSNPTDTKQFTLTRDDVAFIGDQIFQDMRQIQKAYSQLLTSDQVMDSLAWIKRFLWNRVVSRIGFSIYDPTNNNLVYDEWNYFVHYQESVPEELRGKRVGQGGAAVVPLKLPPGAKGTFFVCWSSQFLATSVEEQKLVLTGTGWDIPSKNGTFRADYSMCKRHEAGWYSSGALATSIERQTQA